MADDEFVTADVPPDYPRLTALLGENAVEEIHTMIVDTVRERETAEDIAADPPNQAASESE